MVGGWTTGDQHKQNEQKTTLISGRRSMLLNLRWDLLIFMPSSEIRQINVKHIALQRHRRAPAAAKSSITPTTCCTSAAAAGMTTKS
ncbi:MAG: hypothetical protein CM15mP55_3720 [Hyphomicrobiales bacterium]|nr:MAG: hypothetical protein CM15mP55_3720 [Hyphomicrobiales bacterium]